MGQGSALADDTTSYDAADATTLAHWVARGAVSPAELMGEATERLRRVNPQLNLLSQDHIGLAQIAVQKDLPQGPFTGVPFLLKDLGIQMRGTVTSSGSDGPCYRRRWLNSGARNFLRSFGAKTNSGANPWGTRIGHVSRPCCYAIGSR